MSSITTPIVPAPPVESTPPATRMNVQRRAAAAARIFDVVATVVLIFGGLLVVGQLFGGVGFLIASTGSELGTSPFVIILGMLVGIVLTTIVTAINWAGITLATAVAGYVAQRTPEA